MMRMEKRTRFFGRKLRGLVPQLVIVFLLITGLVIGQAVAVLAANATASVHVVKYAADGMVLAETTKTYEWLRDNLPQQGDGKIHYYHQGPIFEGDVWDPTETENLKDKGAVKGTALRDLCDLVGGMSPGNEIMVKAVDGWHTEFAYENIYEPMDMQGIITLCWYNGEDALFGERYGEGYPGSYYTAMQIVFLAGTTNAEGKYVFGNSDMRICLPDEKYQHFYEGLPSTNGLSGKWIDEVAIFSGEAPVKPGEKLATDDALTDTGQLPLIPIVIGVAGVVIIAGSAFVLLRRRGS
jgi:hypothetical protein